MLRIFLPYRFSNCTSRCNFSYDGKKIKKRGSKRGERDDYRKIAIRSISFSARNKAVFILRGEAAQSIRNGGDTGIYDQTTFNQRRSIDLWRRRSIRLRDISRVRSMAHKSSQVPSPPCVLSAPSRSPINDESSSRLQFPSSQANPRRRVRESAAGSHAITASRVTFASDQAESGTHAKIVSL